MYPFTNRQESVYGFKTKIRYSPTNTSSLSREKTLHISLIKFSFLCPLRFWHSYKIQEYIHFKNKLCRPNWVCICNL